MNRFIVSLLFFIVGSEAFASSCALAPVEVFNTTSEKIIIGFNLYVEKVEPIEHKDENFKEFLSQNEQVHILEPWSYDQISLSFGCGYGPIPGDFWFSHKIWGEIKQYVVEYAEGKWIIIE